MLGKVFLQLGLLGSILLLISRGLFGYSSMGTADLGGDGVFNDVEQFLGDTLCSQIVLVRVLLIRPKRPA